MLSRSMLNRLASPGFGLASAATLGVRTLIGNLIGSSVITDISDFFRLFGTVSVGLRTHAEMVEQWLKAESTRFIWVTTPHNSAVEGTLQGVTALKDMEYPLGHILLNRVTSHSKEAFPDLGRPTDIPKDQWVQLERELKQAWRLADEKADLHDNVRRDLATQMSASTTCIQTVPHDDDPMNIIYDVAQQLAEIVPPID